MRFYDEIKSHAPFFMGDLAKKLAKSDDEIKKTYDRIYMNIRYYHKDDWKCEEKQTGKRGRSPLWCTYVGV